KSLIAMARLMMCASANLNSIPRTIPPHLSELRHRGPAQRRAGPGFFTSRRDLVTNDLKTQSPMKDSKLMSDPTATSGKSRAEALRDRFGEKNAAKQAAAVPAAAQAPKQRSRITPLSSEVTRERRHVLGGGPASDHQGETTADNPVTPDATRLVALT